MLAFVSVESPLPAMNRNLHILLAAAILLPALSPAREETKEERKQRITRKYLREHTNILQSDSMVPEEETPEDLEVTDSERFKQSEVDIPRQQPGTMPAPPRPAPRPIPRAADRNWLLAADPELADPNADPFSLGNSATTPKTSTDWTAWGTEREAAPETESRFDRRNYNADAQQPVESYDSRRQGLFNPRAPIPFSSTGTQQDSPFTKSSGTSIRTPYPSGGLDFSRDNTIDQGRLKSPFTRNTESSTDRSFGSDSSQRNGRIPYINPFQAQRNQRQQGSFGGSSQEYQKPDPFKKWKEQNPTKFDPTREDAFIDELMPNNRR